MLMDPVKLSEVIRAKKKKLMNSEPELVDSGLQADMNPNQIFDMEQTARIESTLDTPHKINEEDSDDSYDGVGLSPAEKTRMPRLRAYFDSMDM